jgi:hypothetical protein
VKRLLVAAFVICLVFSLLVPPWRITVKSSAGHILRNNLTWSLILDMPRDGNANYQETRVAGDVLCVEIIAICVAGAGCWLLSKNSSRSF